MRVNFQPLNKTVMKEKFPVHRSNEYLERLQGSAVYSALNFADAFLQIPIHPDDGRRNEFHSHVFTFWHTCVPFGLINVLAELHRQANHSFSDLINEERTVIYTDGVLVFT